MKRSLIISLFILVFISPVLADILYLNQGEETIGTLISVDENTIQMKDVSGKIHEFKPSEVAHILISKIRHGDEILNTKDITEELVLNVLSKAKKLPSFPDSDYITLHRNRNFEFTKDGRVNYTRREMIQVLKEPGLDAANRSLYYLKDKEDFQLLFAHTYAPDGRVYHITDDAISNESFYSASPEYAKLKKLKLALKKVDIGSIIDFSYRQDLKLTDELHPFSIDRTFGQREPIVNEIVTISYPEDLPIQINKFQWDHKNAPKIIETKLNGLITITFDFKDMKGYIPEQNMISISKIFPRVIAFIKYDWEIMAGMINKAYQEITPDQALLSELIAKAKLDGMSNFDKAAALYTQINKDIRSIGMGINDMGSFIPVSTNITLKKKYGNRQARIAVLYFALKSIGIQANIGFATYNREKVVGKDYPNLSFTTTPILRTVIDDKEFFTDGGSLYRPFSTLSTSLQGATAIYLKDGKFEFCTLPNQTSDWNRYDRNVLVKLLANGTMKVNESIKFRGPFETSLRGLRSSKEKEKRMYAEKRVKQVHPNAVLKSYALSNIEDLNAPAILTLDYTIPQAAQKASDKIMTFKNLWINYDSSSASLAERKFPMRYWATEENTQTVIFDLPQDFKWVEWNKQYHYNSGELSFLADMKQTDSLLVYTDRFMSNTIEFSDNSAYQRYRKCTQTMGQLANQWIVIEKPEEEKPVVEVDKEVDKETIKKPIIDAPEPQG